MKDVITLKNELDQDGTYRVHLMSNVPIERAFPATATVQKSVEAGTHVLQAEWRFRGACEIVCPEIEWRRAVVLWALEKGERVSEQAVEAARIYRLTFKATPAYVWVERLPKGAENGTIIELPIEPIDLLENEMVLLQADFVPRGFLAVGR